MQFAARSVNTQEETFGEASLLPHSPSLSRSMSDSIEDWWGTGEDGPPLVRGSSLHENISCALPPWWGGHMAVACLAAS